MQEVFSPRNQEMLKRRGRLLVGYLPLGYPEGASFPHILSQCEAAGLDVIEIGYPASNPLADGEVIRKAMRETDASLAGDVGHWKQLRESCALPVWIMGYGQDLVDTGVYRSLAEAGVMDALVVPDVTTEQTIRLSEELAPFQVDVVCFTRPSMKEAQRNLCFGHMALFYQQLHEGTTGTSRGDIDFRPLLAAAKEHGHVRAFAGFGINAPQRVVELLQAGFDGAIIGTELLKRLQASPDALYAFIRGCREAIQSM